MFSAIRLHELSETKKTTPATTLFCCGVVCIILCFFLILFGVSDFYRFDTQLDSTTT